MAGIDPADLPRLRIVAATAAGAPHASVAYSTPVERGTAIGFDLPAGPYIVMATMQPQGRIIARRPVKLDANITDLLLQTARPGRLTGRVIFAAAQSRTKPGEIALRAVDSSGWQNIDMVARAPEYRFDSGDIAPGVYTLDLASAKAGYIVRPGREVAVDEGGNTAVQLEVGLDRAQIGGIVSDPSGSPLPHATVAIAKAGVTPMDVQSTQADQKGQFLFSDLQPGEYLLCAWPRIDDDALYTPGTWDQAGEAVKRLKLEPNAQMDGGLTAAAGAPGATP